MSYYLKKKLEKKKIKIIIVAKDKYDIQIYKRRQKNGSFAQNCEYKTVQFYNYSCWSVIQKMKETNNSP